MHDGHFFAKEPSIACVLSRDTSLSLDRPSYGRPAIFLWQTRGTVRLLTFRYIWWDLKTLQHRTQALFLRTLNHILPGDFQRDE